MKTKTKVDWRIIACGIFALTAIEITALNNGIDGKILTIVIGIIALVMGIVIPSPIKIK